MQRILAQQLRRNPNVFYWNVRNWRKGGRFRDGNPFRVTKSFMFFNVTSLTPPGAQRRGVWGLVPVGKRRGHYTRGWLCRWKGRCRMLQLPHPVLKDSSYNVGAKEVSQNGENERLPNPVLSDSLYTFGAKQML